MLLASGTSAGPSGLELLVSPSCTKRERHVVRLKYVLALRLCGFNSRKLTNDRIELEWVFENVKGM